MSAKTMQTRTKADHERRVAADPSAYPSEFSEFANSRTLLAGATAGAFGVGLWQLGSRYSARFVRWPVWGKALATALPASVVWKVLDFGTRLRALAHVNEQHRSTAGDVTCPKVMLVTRALLKRRARAQARDDTRSQFDAASSVQAVTDALRERQRVAAAARSAGTTLSAAQELERDDAAMAVFERAVDTEAAVPGTSRVMSAWLQACASCTAYTRRVYREEVESGALPDPAAARPAGVLAIVNPIRRRGASSSSAAASPRESRRQIRSDLKGAAAAAAAEKEGDRKE